MVEGKMCGVCGKNEASVACSECSIPLCDGCVREVVIERITPTTYMKGVTTSPLRAGTVRKKVCEKCQREVEFI